MSLSASVFINVTLCVEVQSGYAGGEEQKPTSTQMEVIIVTAESAMASPIFLLSLSAQLQMAGCNSVTTESVLGFYTLHDRIHKCLLICGSVVFELTVHDGMGGCTTSLCIFSFSASG